MVASPAPVRAQPPDPGFEFSHATGFMTGGPQGSAAAAVFVAAGITSVAPTTAIAIKFAKPRRATRLNPRRIPCVTIPPISPAPRSGVSKYASPNARAEPRSRHRRLHPTLPEHCVTLRESFQIVRTAPDSAESLS